MSDNGLLAAPKTLPGSEPRKKVVLPDKPVEEAPAPRVSNEQWGIVCYMQLSKSPGIM